MNFEKLSKNTLKNLIFADIKNCDSREFGIFMAFAEQKSRGGCNAETNEYRRASGKTERT